MEISAVEFQEPSIFVLMRLAICHFDQFCSSKKYLLYILLHLVATIMLKKCLIAQGLVTEVHVEASFPLSSYPEVNRRDV